MTSIATLLSGGELVGLGARQAGLDHLWGVEIDPAISTVARDNGFESVCANLLDLDPSALNRPDVLHASPECTTASVANQQAGETNNDFLIASKIVQFVEQLQPDLFTLENVFPYRNFSSFRKIVYHLSRLGYRYSYANLNAVWFGVPQSRRRLWLWASKSLPDGYNPLDGLSSPESTSWYDAVQDLVPTLPEGELAPWQLERLEHMPLLTALFSQGISRDHSGKEYPLLTRGAHEPAYTVTANSNMNGMRAYLVSGQFDRPSSRPHRAPQLRDDHRPAFTVTASHKGDWRAVLISGQNAGRPNITTRLDDEPAFTVTNTAKAPHRAATSNGRIVILDNRCLARFQSLPDSYRLPDGAALASRIIGNGVPPLLYKKLVEKLVDDLL